MGANEQLDIRTVIDELTALTGVEVTVEVHAPSGGSAPRAILSGTAGALAMDHELDSSELPGLVFLPIGAAGLENPGSRSGIYFDDEHFETAKGEGFPGGEGPLTITRLTITLHDETFFVIQPLQRHSSAPAGPQGEPAIRATRRAG